jgi:hypothetical protein
MQNIKAGKGSAASLPNAKLQMPFTAEALAATWTSATTAKLNDIAQSSNVCYVYNTTASAGRTYVYVNATVGWKYTNWDG